MTNKLYRISSYEPSRTVEDGGIHTFGTSSSLSDQSDHGELDSNSDQGASLATIFTNY